MFEGQANTQHTAEHSAELKLTEILRNPATEGNSPLFWKESSSYDAMAQNSGVLPRPHGGELETSSFIFIFDRLKARMSRFKAFSVQNAHFQCTFTRY